MDAGRVVRGRAVGRAHRYVGDDVPERATGRTGAPGRVLHRPDPPTLGYS